jgi:hypothetical protein
MKKIIGILVILLMVSCKNEAKENSTEKPKITEPVKVETKKVETKDVVISEVTIPEISTWFKNGLSINEASETYNEESVVLISRLDPGKPSYSGIDNLKTQYGSTYRITAVVKKADVGKDFALRIQGVYPNRVDAIFDLESGLAKEPLISGNDDLAENPKATIENLGNGWYKCSLYADVFSEYIRVVLGPTNGNLNTGLWETRTGQNNNVYFVPALLTVSEM